MAARTQGELRPPADTIAAVATPPGGGIGVVRISGALAEDILRRLVTTWPKGKAPTHKLHYGYVRDPRSGRLVDEVLAVIMRQPRSYTGEDVGELQTHGGPRVLERVLALVLAEGARLAQPGEFTRRAFESGRLDLARAEAVGELVAARTDRALAAAQRLLSGELGRAVRAARQEVVLALAEIEGALDFPDEELDAPTDAQTAERLRALAATLRGLGERARRFAHERAEVALAGRVNAGKSSLLNALVGEERALVHDEAGTTRDAVEAEVELAPGVRACLVDTAGERGEASGLEARGVELGRRRRARADVVLLIVDGAAGLGEAEEALWRALDGRPRALVWNKSDLAPAPAWPGWLGDAPRAVVSATHGAGIDALRALLVELLGEGSEDAGRLQISLRQRDALEQAAAALERAVEELVRGGGAAEVAALEARGALHHLGLITGETVDAEVLDAIFSRFCIGK